MNQLFRHSLNWSLWIAVITFVLAAIFSIVSTYILDGLSWALGMVIVLIIILIGIFFDMLGIASTAAEETPFHAMASEKVQGAKHAILITRNADRFSSFCNDVVGDVSGIISGTASAIVIIQLTVTLHYNENSAFQYIVSVVFTSVVAALTVGGKAFGKSIAIKYSTDIIYHVGKLFYFLEDKFNIVIIKESKKKRNKKKLSR